MKLTQQRLKEVLKYNPLTGVFYWVNPQAYCMHAGEKAGYLDRNGYIYIKVDSVKHAAHRLAWLYMHGVLPEKFIDHKNTIRSDNRIKNLRLATRSQNMMNQLKRKNNTSGVKGIGWDNKVKKWRARCQVDGKRQCVGWFSSLKEAEKSLIKFREKGHGEFANHGGA
ncbi:HNH endonuclease [Kosakonia oryziphila]|uniref:HNH endonuclease n=1 Tax=Kosakonia oryziphila TaxID=1005667 RepID=A0A1C4DUU4_9ENTR|nr:HNH endonuclease [Kosakonia oryziphila]SCC35176.1 HNH endonuclease [Kosakonia oryziphila]